MFFIAVRNDIEFDFHKLDMSFNYAPITYGQIKTGDGIELNHSTRIYKLLCKVKDSDKSLSDIVKREEGKDSLFNYCILQEDYIFSTITAGSAVPPMRAKEKTYCSLDDIIHAQTFPEDYDFEKKNMTNVRYICGMSVPPVMMKRVVERVIETGVFK